MIDGLHRGAGALVRWLYPERALCLGCQTLSGCSVPWLCAECAERLARSQAGVFQDPLLDGCAAAYAYAGVAGKLVRGLKYQGWRVLASDMAQAMAEAFEPIRPSGTALLVPVPMHPRRRRIRGMNHAELLAEALAPLLEMPVNPALHRVRPTRQMAKLPQAKRSGALEGAFQATDAVRGQAVVLIDDVYTSGETAHACAKALRESGALTVTFLSYAKG